MENTFQVRPFENPSQEEPLIEVPTLADTAKARFMNGAFRVGLNIVDDMKSTEFDPLFDVEEFIEEQGLTGGLASMVKARGSLSRQDAEKQVANWNNYFSPAQRTLQNSSFLNLMGTDPVLLTSFIWPLAIPARFRATTSLTGSLTSQNAARATLGRQPLSMSEIGILEGAVLDGSMNLNAALREIEEGADPAEALSDAALFTGVSMAAGGIIGRGFDELGPTVAKAKQEERINAFNNGMREWIDASKKRVEEGQEPADFDFTAQWFTDSIVFKAVPTPMKSILNNKELPQWFKMETLKLANDSGLMLALNQSGNIVGNSVWQRAARRNGEWVRAYTDARDAWSKLNPRGGATFANVELQAMAETVRKRIGRESFTVDDFMESLGRNYILKKGDDLTQVEKQALASVKKYFMDNYNELNDLGFLQSREIKTYRVNAENRLEKDVEFYEEIFGGINDYMRSRVDKLTQQMNVANSKLDELDQVFNTRGLTKRQQTLQAKLIQENAQRLTQLKEFEDIFDVIDGVNTIDDLFAAREFLSKTKNQDELLKNLEDQINKNRSVLEELRAREAGLESSLDNWFPRFWNRKRINEDRKGLHSILSKWYAENPSIVTFDEKQQKFVTMELDTSPDAISKRADETIDAILGETDDEILDTITMGKGKHFARRSVDIPNELVLDYIQTNVRDVMIAYSDRVSPRIEFQRTFGNYAKTKEGAKRPKLVKQKDLDAGLRQRLADEGLNEDQINEAMKNFNVLYDRVVGTVIKNPDAISRKAVNWLRTVTSWTYLGGAGISAIADTATLFMDHEARNVARGLGALWDDVDPQKSLRELQLSGEALDIVKNLTHARHMETLSRDVFNDLPDKINNFFYTANGLGPVTVAAKLLDGLVRGHTIIEASIRKSTGEASQFEIEFLARYNISDADANRIADLATQADSPISQSNNGLFLPNTEEWADEGLVDVFRNALRSGVANRIIMAGPADKPIMMDGVAYIPMSIGRQFGMQEDEIVKGYARYENAFLSLPFTFYTYTLGAMNKITANYAQGAVRSKAMHFAVAMGLGYGIVKSKTPDWRWNEMDPEDKVLRAFDFSGLAALYSDMLYRGLETAQSFGADDMIIEPRFKQKPDPVGGVVSIAGAPADYVYDGVKALKEFMQGDYSDGAKQIGRMIPFSNLILGGDYIKDAVDGLAGALPNRP